MSTTLITLRASSAPVKSVTIFQSWTAEVTRTLALELKSGKNLVKISGISSQAESESPRISGAPNGVRVLDVACMRKPPFAPDLRDDTTTTDIEWLSNKLRALEAQRDVRRQEVSALEASTRAIAEGPRVAGDAPNWHAELLGFMDGLVQRQLAAQKAVQDLDIQITALEKKLWVLRNARRGEASTTITATIAADSDVKVELSLTYLVSGVTWQPFYDLHATTADGRPSANVSLRYCASITQSTGEDWTDTTLTLSTATSQAQWRLSVPSVSPLKVTVGPPPPPAAQPFAFPPRPAFGAPTAPPLPAAAPPPAPTASVFGSFGNARESTAAQGTGAFGVPVQIATSQPTGGPFFGAPTTGTSAPTSGGLFGSSTSTAAPAAPGGGLFPGSGGGLFGKSASSTTPAGGLFGSSSGSGQAPSTGGLFGSPSGTASAITGAFGSYSRTAQQPEDAPAPPPSPPPPPPPPPAPVPSRNALSVAYRLPEKASILSDGEAHKLTIAALEFSAALKYVCVPQQSQAVFIVGTVKNTSEYELLAGPVSVFMDDSFVTKTSVEFIAVNESFPCVLGLDTSLKVTYRQSSKTEHEPRRNFAEPHKTIARTATTTITNQHAHAVTGLVVRDAIPLGNEDAGIAVMLRRPAGLAEVSQGQEVDVKLADAQEGVAAKVRWTKVEEPEGKGGEKDGLYEWVCAIPAGKKISLEAQWDVKGPSDVQWHEARRIRGLFG